MKIALIIDGVCVNTIIVESLEKAKDIYAGKYEYIIECPHGRGISHLYDGEEWHDPIVEIPEEVIEETPEEVIEETPEEVIEETPEEVIEP